MTRWTKILERASQVAVIVTVILVSIILGKEYFQHSAANNGYSEHAQSRRVEIIGKRIELPGANLEDKASKKVILTISSRCHFCEESTPFYQQLGSLKDGRFRLIAALPQGKTEGLAYLRDHHVQVDAVVSSRALSAVGVRSTPTLIIVGASGEVEQVWVGLLSEERKKEVLSKLDLTGV